ncbi:methyl-CpG-binding domain-containing protein 2-like [Salvia miltiorrhiza]|uniref:methyl-CpG-binding domain-containing protein 2-like n=1 Tax=Salvia miltiorrhiza TaxID=226208 RepID=UPI0025AD2213|nr:methyl-CpG-binding domain-containing protein 2-like [Salvia miltiorrhiza]
MYLQNNLFEAMEETDGVQAKKVWESVKLYTVRCGVCSKWRLIPSKHKYEEIRAKLGEEMFECATAREWRPQISCAHESDVEQDDGNFRWAMDKPNIPQTPPAWQRILRIRAEGGTKFADVYYVSPSNKRLRSMVELSRYLEENPRYEEDKIKVSHFSFQPPLPLDHKYVAKRQTRVQFASNTQNCGGKLEAPSQN